MIAADTLLLTRLSKQYSKYYDQHFMELDICYVTNKNDEEYVDMDGLTFV